jgi:hypothetical protein
MTLVEQQILDHLLALQAAVARMSTATPKPDLLPIFLRLDELTRQLPPGTEPDLLHFLHRKSYQKACALLQQRQRGTI